MTIKCEQTRQKIKLYLNARFTEEIVFTRGTTEAINLVAYSWGFYNLKKGDEIIISEMEHHSNIVPWHIISRLTGAKIRKLAIENDGTIKLDNLKKLLNKNTKLVTIVHVSNVLGTVNNIREICDLAHEQGAYVLTDGAQSSGHMKIDLQELGSDFFTISGHKVYGPTGIGALYIKKEMFDQIHPFHGGGHMIKKVTIEDSNYKDVPDMLEAGTMPLAEIVGLSSALDYVTDIDMENITKWEMELGAYAYDVIRKVRGIKIYGPSLDKKTAIFSFTHDEIHPHDIATVLDYEGIAIRAGHHCTQPLMNRFGIQATARVSLSFYNTKEEIDRFGVALEKAVSFFKK